jgi:hypothetical protein
MTWTYDLTELATSEVYQIRLEIGDTDGSDQLLQDEEITQNIAVEMNLWGAAARCCEQISRVFLRKADIRLGRVLYLLYGKQATQYMDMAKCLRVKALGANVPWIGGQFVEDKITYAEDESLVKPKFAKEMMTDPWVGVLGSDTDNSTAGLPIGEQ